MVSVERVLEYKNLSPESTTSSIPPPNWPQRGVISFRNASLKYPQKDQPALRDLFFTIREREKVNNSYSDYSTTYYVLIKQYMIEHPCNVKYMDYRRNSKST